MGKFLLCALFGCFLFHVAAPAHARIQVRQSLNCDTGQTSWIDQKGGWHVQANPCRWEPQFLWVPDRSLPQEPGITPPFDPPAEISGPLPALPLPAKRMRA